MIWVNLSWRKVEQLLHRFFFTRPGRAYLWNHGPAIGRKVYPREWFYVLPEHVSRAVQSDQGRDPCMNWSMDPETQHIRSKIDK